MMRVDAAELEIFKNLFHSTAEEMGAALRRSAFSPNIKERRDYSCAVFDGRARVVAMGDHMPVHLGSMPMSVAAALRRPGSGPRRHRHAERSVRGWHAPAGHHAGDAGVGAGRRGERRSPQGRTPFGPTNAKQAQLLRCQSRPPCRRGRRTARLHGAQSGNLSGRPAHPARGAGARRKDSARCPCHPPRQRADAARTRGRFDGPGGGLPIGGAPPARTAAKIWNHADRVSTWRPCSHTPRG